MEVNNSNSHDVMPPELQDPEFGKKEVKRNSFIAPQQSEAGFFGEFVRRNRVQKSRESSNISGTNASSAHESK